MGKISTKQIVLTIAAAATLGIVGAANGVAFSYAGIIDHALNGQSREIDSEAFEEVSAQSGELVKKIAEEGIALVRNENKALPLDLGEEKRINVFGWASTDNGFLLKGIGSGSSTIQADKTVTLLGALRAKGIEYNTELIQMYENYYKGNFSFATGNSSRQYIIEPPQSNYTEAIINNAVDFSDVALVTISRVAGENIGEIPQTQRKLGAGVSTDNSRHYLQISKEEEDLIKMCKENFDKVIVIINSSNQMELGFLEKYDVDACLNVGLMGQNGAEAIPEILLGEVNPSGRLTDTHAYDYKAAPSYKNYLRQGSHIQYVEDIYFGYKYYETADVEGLFDDVDNEYGQGYDGVVQYPFGYGLSYTTFEWKLTNSNLTSITNLTKDTKIELEFSCTNTGNVAGKDVMQIYVEAPFNGEVEKAAIQLVDFEKTALIPAGQTQTGIKFSIDPYYFASFDCYDRNENGEATFELDKGNYNLRFMENAHVAKKMEAGEANQYTLKVNEIQVYDKDPVTGNEVKTRLTGSDAYSGVPLDGSTISNNPTPYLTRDTMSTGAQRMPSSFINSVVTTANNFTNHSFDQDSMPITSANNGLYIKKTTSGGKASSQQLNTVNNPNTVFDEDLIEDIAADYDSEELTKLIDQLSADDACYIVENCGFGTPAIESIGKEKTYDFDGPAGFNTTVQGFGSTALWTAFPSETLVGQTFDKFLAKQMGLAVGYEGKATGVAGWYAPGCNLHRSPFNARNYEYYSEDPILSGYLTANVVEGARANGVYAYVKHFCLSEPGENARNLNTWLTEQNYRENYMRPFELAVKVGGANAMMTAFNSVGGCWAGANYAQNVEILRGEWGFRGTLLTDWSTGDGNMNGPRGVRAGNDIWLNPNTGSMASKLSRSNATDVYCAKQAARNVVYTFCSTYQYAKTYDHSNDIMNVEIGKAVVKENFSWWRPVVFAIDGLAVVGVGVWMFFTWKGKKVVSGGSALEQAGEQNIDLNNEALDASETNVDFSEGDGGAE
ncbi:MAG: glycoside hydrolase family 3 protein [Bacilli bacterium]|nr:glycoside hydrolase family 3 protein [Bacilli bacterium]